MNPIAAINMAYKTNIRNKTVSHYIWQFDNAMNKNNHFTVNPLTPRRTLVAPFTKISILF